MTRPWLSVIVPTYNGAAYLAETLASIERQGDGDIEVIAVDDGSSDGTLEILRDHSTRLPLRIIPRQRIGNWVANTNHGIAQAQGDYVCFLHQDDLWLPGRLQMVRDLIARAPDAELLLHASRYIDARGHFLGTWRCPLPAGRVSSETLVERLLIQNFIAVPAPVWARRAAQRVGNLDEALWYTADWDFWLRLAASASVVYSPRALSAFRIHSQSQTAQGVARAAEMRRQIKTVLMRYLPAWEASRPGRAEIGHTASVSMEINHALACLAYGERPNFLALARQTLALGPAGWHRLLRDSRLTERIGAQLRARFASPRDRQTTAWVAKSANSPSPRFAVSTSR